MTCSFNAVINVLNTIRKIKCFIKKTDDKLNISVLLFYKYNMKMTAEKTNEVNKEDDYDPFEHRQVEKPNSDIRSTANLIKASLGSGLLAVPLAYSNSGWAVGIVGTLIIGLICGHCVHILVKTSRACCKMERKPLLGYAETCKAAFANGPKAVKPFANIALVFAESAMFFTYVGVCCVYTVLISDSIKQVIDQYFPATIWPIEYYCLILLIPLCLMTQIRHLKWLAPLSLTANILLFSTFIICLYYIFRENIVLADRKLYNDLSRLPAFLSTVIFAMEGIGVVMPVENVMKKPQHFLGFPSVLVTAMGIIIFLYSTLGLFGYFRYGDILRGSITLNLPVDHWPAICGKCFIALSIFLTYPLQFFVVMDIFTKYTEPHVKGEYRNIVQVVSRVVGVTACVAIGIALPMLEQIINFVGAFFYSILGILVPCVIETVFYWEDLGKYQWKLWKNVIIIIFSICALVSGCTVAIKDMIDIINGRNE